MAENLPDLITRLRLDMSEMQAGVGRAAAIGGAIGGAIGSVVGPAIAGALGAIRDFVGGSVDAFAELEDSTAAAGVIFGASMASIIEQSKTAASTLGLSSQQVINAANTFGTYGKSAGLAGDELAAFSTDMTGLAGDLASFKGTSTEQAIEAIGSALRGEAEPIRAYGVLLDDATLKARALALGIADGTSALTPQQKVLAAQAEILAQTTDAQGDFARTMNSTANVAKTLGAETDNLQAKFGTALAPAFTLVRAAMTLAVRGMSAALDEWLPRIQAFYDRTNAVWQAVGDLLSTGDFTAAIGDALRVPEDSPLIDFLLDMRDAFTQAGGGFSGLLAGAQAGIASVVDWLASGGIQSILNAVLAGRQRLFDAALQLFPVLIDAVVTVLPGLVDWVTGTMVPAIVGLITSSAPMLLVAAVTLFGGLATGLGQVLPSIVASVAGLLPTLLSAVLGMVPGMLNAAMVLFTTVVQAAATALPLVVGAVVGMLPSLVGALVSFLPTLLTTAVRLFTTLVDAVMTVLPSIIGTLLSMLPSLITTLLGMLPSLLQAAVSLFLSLVTGALQALPQIVTALLGMLPTLLATLLGMLPQLLAVAVELFTSLVDAIVTVLPEIVTVLIGTVLPQLLGTILDMLPSLLTTAITLFLSIVTAVAKALPRIVTAIIGILPTLIATILGMVPQLLGAAVTLFLALVVGIAKALPQIIGALGGMGLEIIRAVGKIDLADAGRTILDGFLRGLKAGFEQVKGFVSGIGDWIAAHKGPKSYDLALLRPAGGWIMRGLRESLADGIPELQKTLRGVADTVAGVDMPEVTASARGAASGYGAPVNGAGGALAAQQGATLVRVYLGNEEFTDHVRVVVTDTLVDEARAITAGGTSWQ